MHPGRVRFISQLAFVCVILLVLIGIGLIARHIDRDFTPSPAIGSEPATMPEMPDVEELSIEELSILSDQTLLTDTDFDQNVTDPFWNNDRASAVQSDQNEPNLPLPDDLTGEPTSPPDPPEGTEGDPNNALEAIDEHPVVSGPNSEHATMQKLSTEQPADQNDNPEITSKTDVNSTADKDETSSPAKEEPIKVKTKIGYVETVLKKADFEPYQASGRTEGLQMTGLERISVAKHLGLKNGDVIRTINGQQLSSPRQAYGIFKKARKQPIMKVDLLRDGEPKALVFVFR